MSDVTQILERVEQGDGKAAEELLPLVYEELRKLAAAKMAQEAQGHTLQPTALVHEAWLRLVGAHNQQWNSRGHFFGAAAEAMRRILVENARRKNRLRHGGGQGRVGLDETEIVAKAEDEKVLQVDGALEELGREDPVQAQVARDAPGPSRPQSLHRYAGRPGTGRIPKPHEIITALDLKPGETVADIGAGSGYFTFRLARHVGDTGRVYAVDVSPDMILHRNRRIHDLQVTNVVSILSALDDPLLVDASIDRFFICDTWHHIDDHAHYLALMKKMLKPGGQVVMIDFKKAQMPVGPPMEMRIDRDDLLKEMEANGFKLTAENSFLPYQYFLVFKLN